MGKKMFKLLYILLKLSKVMHTSVCLVFNTHFLRTQFSQFKIILFYKMENTTD